VKTEEILKEREKTHGDYEEVANLAYDMKKAIDSHLSFDRKGPDDNNKVLKKKHLISINMILLKIARIICGDPDFDDHWDDIAGYAMLGKGKAKGVFWAGEPCKCPNKRREYFTDTADGLKTIMTADHYCISCSEEDGKVNHFVDCEQKENKITVREWINKHGSAAFQAEIKKINEEIEAQKETEKKDDECTCYTMPGTEEFVKCRKCQNRRCAICHVTLGNHFLYTPCASTPDRIECNFYFCWDCVEKHENSTSSRMEHEELQHKEYVEGWMDGVGACQRNYSRMKKEIEQLKEELNEAEARRKDAETYWDTLRQEVQKNIDKVLKLTQENMLLKNQIRDLKK
jgi:hypothetical protein